jgi:vancomycin resistance protein YoaR
LQPVESPEQPPGQQPGQQFERPTSLLPPGPVRASGAAGGGLPNLGGEFPPGPQFVPPGDDAPDGPPDGSFVDLSGLEPTPVDEHRSRVRRRLAIGAGIALALVVGYGGVAWALSTRIPSDTTIAGVAVGGLNHGAAAQKLRDTLGSRSGPVQVTVGEAAEQLDPVAAGLTFDPDTVIADNLGFTLSPFSLWHRFVGGLAIAPGTSTDRGKLTAAMTELASRTRVDPRDATVEFPGGRAVLREPVPGRSLDVIAAVELVDRRWLAATGPIALPVTEQEPTTTREEAQDALNRIATPALSGPLVVAVGDERVSLTPEQFSGALSMKGSEVGALSLVVNGPRLREVVLAADPGLEHDATDAKFVVAGGKPKLVPAVDGVTIAPEDLADAAQRALTGTDRTAVLNPAPKPAKFTTAMAQALGIKEKTSSWSTPLSGSAGRITNLRVATRTLNGVIVKPGETFSLNGALGERTAEKGYKEAIIISEGAYEKGLGGGVSNVATLTFNNVFFSGLKDITHKPHSFYISHYPVGREATVHWPDVDLKWKNDSPYGVLITAGVDSEKVHMEFWSTKVWDIKAINGPRTNFRAPKVIFSTKPLCVPQNPSSGFDINVTRVFSKDGREVRREVFRTSYIAQDDITCGEKPATTTTTTAPGGIGPGDD